MQRFAESQKQLKELMERFDAYDDEHLRLAYKMKGEIKACEYGSQPLKLECPRII